MIAELAPAKLNLVLRVGARRADGLHPICSLFASIDLCDELELRESDGGDDIVTCPGVPGDNLAARALAAFRERAGLPAMDLRIEKRIPVAAGLGGGSADAAAALRAANRIAGEPLDAGELRELARGLGADVPSQVEPGHALVQGAGELVEPVDIPALHAVIASTTPGLATADVYAELDRLRSGSAASDRSLDPEPLRAVAAGPPGELAAALSNDLEQATLSLRPELSDTLASLRAAGAPGAAVSGSGPTCFALFEERDRAERAAAGVPGAMAVSLRGGVAR
jgi:4-diphosphocytidyl-2-C-methyl-D-erythritol kinase